MSDNLPASVSPSTQPFAPLPGHALVLLQGPDAAAFAQAQFANDVAALAPGRWQWNACLTAKGRVIAMFALLKLAEDDVRLVVPDMPAEAFCAELRRFVFRRKLGIAVADWQVQGAFGAPTRARDDVLDIGADAIELDHGGAAGPRTLRLAPALHASSDRIEARWREADLLHGLPRLPETQRETWTPQQLSLERLRAFSVRKGCYPGQEIVARTHFLGKAKRGLALLETTSPAPPGAQVSQDGQAAGQVVCSVAVEADRPALALAVLPLGLDPAAALEVHAPASVLPARLRPLADGLAR